VVKKTHGIAQGPKMGPIQVYESMKVKEPAEVNFKHGVKEIVARSARKLIPCSPTFKMMAPSLNVVHWYRSS